jgi:CheY-like chemotaxis protein
MHGGSISVSSEGPGKGSEFTVYLPVAEATEEAEPAAATPSGKLLPIKPVSSRILVVDDNHDSADSLGLLLELMGNEVRIVHDGLEALAVANEFQPRVILLDIGLPSINGYEVARTIRGQNEAWARNALLIAVTGWGDESDRQLSKEAGFDHHLVKPLDPDALNELLFTH